MIYTAQKSMLSYLIKSLLVIFILTGIFGLVWLRSSITQIEYQIGVLEAERASALKEIKTLIAKRASALSMEVLQVRGIEVAGLGYPDRKKVIHVKRQTWGTTDASHRGDEVLDEQKGGNP
ncbi:MAG: hypothetical protein HY805_05370 [Nitrospirae bacterium]|nr:hypothetical protein [Nitrospirota bacterium]